MFKFHLGALLLSSSLLLANSDPIIWSGVGYLVDSGQTSKLYPFSSQIEEEYDLAKVFREKLSNDDQIIIGGLGNRSFDEGLNSILLAITSERVDSIYRGKKEGNHLCYRDYLISTQVILYSSQDKEILKATPLTKRATYIDNETSKKCKTEIPNKDFHKVRVAGLLWGIDTTKSQIKNELLNLGFSQDEPFSEDLKKYLSSIFNIEEISTNGILGEQINQIKNIQNIDSKGNEPIGVRNIEITNYAKNQLIGGADDYSNHGRFASLKTVKDKELKEWIGGEFSKWLSNTLKISIVPYYEGKGLTLNVGTTFSDSVKALNLKKPELSYGFDYRLRGYHRFVTGETGLRIGMAYGVFSEDKFGVVFEDELEEISAIPMTETLTKEHNKSDGIDYWLWFDKALELNLRNYSASLVKLDKKWLKDSTEIKSRDFNRQSKEILQKVGYEK